MDWTVPKFFAVEGMRFASALVLEDTISGCDRAGCPRLVILGGAPFV